MTRYKSSILIILVFLALSTCIEPFSPVIDSQSSSKIVVDGQITDREGYQFVSISTTST
ncbi:MAG TPA: hypothetical protein DIW31_05550, partial [Bacteroidales bacterium]|nr:hypothetical protein [Bacteroidales bacterium]